MATYIKIRRRRYVVFAQAAIPNPSGRQWSEVCIAEDGKYVWRCINRDDGSELLAGVGGSTAVEAIAEMYRLYPAALVVAHG